MNNDERYLWDKTGPVDVEVRRLEELLAPLRQGSRRGRRPWWPLAAAASILIALAASLFVPSPAPRLTSWTASETEGSVELGGKLIAEKTPLLAGQLLRTGSASSAAIEMESFGRLDIAPESALRVVQSTSGSQRLRLERGLIHALIWARPGQFVVDTPSVRAVDLGCEYSLSVEADGGSVITVQTGWVAYQFEGRESFIPAGASCRADTRNGPGIPVFEDAPAPLRLAVDAYNRRGDPAEVPRILTAARARDGLTLWHLMVRVPLRDRGAVFDRFAQFAPLPAGVTREGVLALDRRMLDLCWDALNLDDAEWWREWKQEWRINR